MGRGWRSRTFGLIAVALAVGSSIVLIAGAASAEELPEGYAATKYGPLGPADRDLLIKVRWAGLWEMPAGDQAQRRGADPRVREIGAKISAEHHELDIAVRAAAKQLGVELPNEPNADQRDWLSEMDKAKGEKFDRVFIDRLRQAHGKIFSVIAYVRAGTRNELVRSFAATANAAVLRHMIYLESSGLVDCSLLDAPPDPVNPSDFTRVAGLGTRGLHPTVIWIVLGAAAVAGVATTIRLIQSR